MKGTTSIIPGYESSPHWPANGRAVIHALGAAQQAKGLQITNVALIGCDAKVEWHQSDDALDVKLPASRPGKYAYVLKVTLAP